MASAHNNIGGGIQRHIVLLPAVHQSPVPLDPGLTGKGGRRRVLSHVGHKTSGKEGTRLDHITSPV